MKLTTLCYIEQDGKYLMLYRNKKKNDPSKDKWIGVGGKFENVEGADECVLREVKEETGLTLKNYKFRGIISFQQDWGEPEYMHIFTADEFEGTLAEECSEGELRWVDKDKIMDLNLWEGDRIFLKLLLEDAPCFFMTLRYEGEKLVEHSVRYPGGHTEDNA